MLGWNEIIEKIDELFKLFDVNFDIYVVILMWSGMFLSGGYVELVFDVIK